VIRKQNIKSLFVHFFLPKALSSMLAHLMLLKSNPFSFSHTEDDEKGGGAGNESDDSDACSMIGAESQFVVDMCGNDAGAYTLGNNMVADTVPSLAVMPEQDATTEAAADADDIDHEDDHDDVVSRAAHAAVKPEKERLW
jgi:hypothetical protein